MIGESVEKVWESGLFDGSQGLASQMEVRMRAAGYVTVDVSGR
jgi:hypothetical protein